MKITRILVLLFLISSKTLFAQNPKPSTNPPTDFGSRGKMGITDAKMFDQMLKTINGVGSTKDMLAEQSLKSYMMPPRKMGIGGATNSSCYALASALEYYINLNNNYKDNLSPDFIKLNLPKGTIEDELAFLGSSGTVSAAILPYSATNLPPSVNAALKYKISNYLKLFQATTRPQQKLYDMRKAITRGNPVVVEVQITNEFKNLKQVRIWNVAEGDKTPAGTHFLVVVGYNEDTKTVELLNSWGREWGSGGYIRMGYEDFGALAVNGYVLLQ
jgi:Papain family cysteine protease